MSPHVTSTAILIVHWLIVVSLSIRVIVRRVQVGVSLAWLAVVFSVPFAGAALYLFFGEKRLGRGRMARIRTLMVDVGIWQDQLRARCASNHMQFEAGALNAETAPIFHQTETLLGFPALRGNDIELLCDFQSIFDRLVADIDKAESFIHLEFYIWHAGGRTDDIVEALARAAERGVACRALADAMGSKAFLRNQSVRRLRSAGVELAAVLPTGAIRTLVARSDLRNHRKIVVIDERVAYTGSQNLVDPRFFKQQSGVGQWVDAMARITGPATASLDAVFRLDWAIETGEAFEPPALPQDELPPAAAPGVATSSSSGSTIQIVPSGPAVHPEAIHQILLASIYAARRELVMTTPYFVPDESMLTALLSAALRGVEVTLIVPAKNDSVLVSYASVAHFDDLMSAGVRIELFEGGLLHTKSLTIDGAMSVFGSVNLDMRSLWLNFEISLLVYDPDFTSRLRLLQESYLGNSQRLELESWRRRPAWHQFVEDSCRLVGPLL